MSLPTSYPRAVFPVDGVDSLSEDTVVVKYMAMWKFQSLINTSELYFCKISSFDDKLEGRRPGIVESNEHPEIQEWFDKCRDLFFVCCWNLDEDEKAEMWDVYAGNDGVRVRSTVGRLKRVLSSPPLPPGFDFTSGDSADGFSIGKVEYFNEADVDEYEVRCEGLANIKPAFKKRHNFAGEREFRAVLRAGSASGTEADARKETHVKVPVRLAELICEVDYLSVSNTSIGDEVQSLVNAAGLVVPVNASAFHSRAI